jgi:tryptophan halogenase
MALPDSLRARIDRYQANGRIRHRPGELFSDLSWFYIFEGMGLRPGRHDPLMDVVTGEQLREILGKLARATREAAGAAPSHDSHFADRASAMAS